MTSAAVRVAAIRIRVTATEAIERTHQYEVPRIRIPVPLPEISAPLPMTSRTKRAITQIGAGLLQNQVFRLYSPQAPKLRLEDLLFLRRAEQLQRNQTFALKSAVEGGYDHEMHADRPARRAPCLRQLFEGSGADINQRTAGRAGRARRQHAEAELPGRSPAVARSRLHDGRDRRRRRQLAKPHLRLLTHEPAGHRP